MRILLLEAGGSAEDPDDQALYEGEVADPLLHSPPDKYRQRRFGGSTTIWGGRCVPFDPIEIEQRSWIPDSGWPISHHEVAPITHERTPYARPGTSSTTRNALCRAACAPC